jgi:hypothetical protein
VKDELTNFLTSFLLKNLNVFCQCSLPWSAAHVAYSLIRPKSQISNIRHDGTLSIGNFFMLKRCIFLDKGKGSSQGRIPGLLGHGSKVPVAIQ